MAVALASFGALLTTSCSGGTSAVTCVTGRNVECACTSGAMGAQTCTAAGIFSPCSCPSGLANTATSDDELSCEAVTDHIMSVLLEEARRRGEDAPANEVESHRADTVEKCRDSNWPLAARQCALNAGDPEAIGGCMSGVEGMDDVEKSKTAEAREFVKKLYDGARAYYMDPNYARGSITPIPSQFPTLSVGPTPPLGTCCSQGGKCEPSASQWDHETWTALLFSVDDPHYYSYTYITPDPFTEFTVRANGDLDCDGEYSTFEMLGFINAEYSDGPARSAGVARVRELE